MYKEVLALNNLQWLICHKTQPTQIHEQVLHSILILNYFAFEMFEQSQHASFHGPLCLCSFSLVLAHFSLVYKITGKTGTEEISM